MLQTFIITLREGIEAFLIVCVMLTYLAKTGRQNLFKPVYYGIATAVVASIGFALLLGKIGHKALAEGIFAIVAAVLVLTLTVHMMKVGKHMKQKITDKIEKHATKKSSVAAVIGLFLFTVIMITREGFEIALLMKSLAFKTSPEMMIIGAALGVLGSLTVGVMWIKYSKFINIGRFLKVTAVFLILFSIHLFMYGIHELAETKYLASGWLHELGESYSKKSILVQIFNVGIIAVPVLWLGSAAIREKFLKPKKLAAA